MAHTNITRLDLRAAIGVALLVAAVIVIAAILPLSPAAHAAGPGGRPDLFAGKFVEGGRS
jgi:hypothetical protein